ncbi:unnamed protein product [Staurois parvus]|uniref:Uncharacterized protein n=1 Tax=Staurois parvus TaxID=386267 RepID=A0ABN9B9I1_9NEOB|nr:unnamed protein product [Staurois parvus]
MGPLSPCPNSKKPIKKGTRGISWGPPLTPGPLGQCPSFQMVSPTLLGTHSQNSVNE